MQQCLQRLARVAGDRAVVNVHPLLHAAAAGEREARRHSDRRHVRKSCQPIHRLVELAVEASSLCTGPDLLLVEFLPGGQSVRPDDRVPGARRDDVGRVVAAIDRDETDEAAQEQDRPHQQHQRQRHLGRGQHRPRPVGAQQPEAARGPCTALHEGAERLAPGQLAPGQLKSRRGAEHQPDDHRQPQREGEHRAVEFNLVETHDVARYQRRHDAEQDGRDRQPQHAAAQAQQHALGQNLAHDPAPPGAQRRAERQRPPAGHTPRQQQPGDVDAGDQQHQRDGRGQRGQGRTILADHLLPQRNRPDTDLPCVPTRLSFPSPVRAPGPGTVHVPQDAVDLGSGLPCRDVRPEPSQHDGGRLVRRHHVGRPGLLPGTGEVEALRQHAHHGAALAADFDDRPDDVRIRAEAPGPGAVAH